VTKARPLLLLWGTILTSPVEAQLQLGGQAIPIVTTTTAVPGGTALAEGRLVQPVLRLQAAAWGGRLHVDALGDFEGWMMPHGQLTTGAYGEGFVDRRHPHTFVHEFVVSAPDLLGSLDGPVAITLAAGKGFVPYGTDDPMSRSPLLYPVNHHIAQVLERAVAIAAVRAGPVTVEGAVFNGDEPERPAQWPNWRRFGDSWATRVTFTPLVGLEWQLSRGHVHSPEHRAGAGLDAEQWSTSLRWERGFHYAFIEWARRADGGAFLFHTLLAEGAWQMGRHRPYARLERTERPEEQRIDDGFRSLRPHLDNSILGITRWSIGTLGYSLKAGTTARGRVTFQPTIEGSVARVARVTGLFDPAVFYKRSTLYTMSIGVRMDWAGGMAGHRMGRYSSPAPHQH
jgi:hypothetical protein